MTDMQLEFPFAANLVPGVMCLWSSVKSAPAFPLSFRMEPAALLRREECNVPVKLFFKVQGFNYADRVPKGKEFLRTTSDMASIRTPIGSFCSLDAGLSLDDNRCILQLNPAYFRLARMSIGNVQSVGNLLRDLSNISLLRKNFCLLHAAGFESNGKATLLVGLSNTGKTTTVFDLVSNSGVRCYGDDLVVTDGENLYACPNTVTNIGPDKMSSFLKRMSQYARRYIPFYEYFGPLSLVSISDFIGPEKIAPSRPIDRVIFLQRHHKNTCTEIESDLAATLLIASNRTEFTHYSSPLFHSGDYLNLRSISRDAIIAEDRLLCTLSENAHTVLVQGDLGYFRSTIESFSL